MAEVVELEPVGDRADQELVGEPVRADLAAGAVRSGADVEQAVAPGRGAGPQPAAAWPILVDLRPEPGLQIRHAREKLPAGSPVMVNPEIGHRGQFLATAVLRVLRKHPAAFTLRLEREYRAVPGGWHN